MNKFSDPSHTQLTHSFTMFMYSYISHSIKVYLLSVFCFNIVLIRLWAYNKYLWILFLVFTQVFFSSWKKKGREKYVLFLGDKKRAILCGAWFFFIWRLYGNRKNLVFCMAKTPFFPFFGKHWISEDLALKYQNIIIISTIKC